MRATHCINVLGARAETEIPLDTLPCTCSLSGPATHAIFASFNAPPPCAPCLPHFLSVCATYSERHRSAKRCCCCAARDDSFVFPARPAEFCCAAAMKAKSGLCVQCAAACWHAAEILCAFSSCVEQWQAPLLCATPETCSHVRCLCATPLCGKDLTMADTNVALMLVA